MAFRNYFRNQRKEKLEMDKYKDDELHNKKVRFQFHLSRTAAGGTSPSSAASVSKSKPALRSSTMDYLKLCAPSLGLDKSSSSALSTDISPNQTYVADRWGSQSRNWILWSIWEPSLSNFPFFRKSEHPDSLNKQNLTIRRTRSQLNTMLEEVVTQLAPEDFERFQESYFIVLLITQKNIEAGYSPHLQRFEVKVEQAHCETHPGLSDQTTARSLQERRPDSMVAYGGLAQILSSVVEYWDVLIVFGGYKLEPNEDGGFSCALNFNEKEITGIIRIPQNKKVDKNVYSPPPIFMMEKIEPRSYDDYRFRFTYKALKDNTKREMILHRNFTKESFTENVAKSFVTRDDFPTPIARGIDYQEVFDSFFSLPCGMPLKHSPTPCMNEVSTGDESHYRTAGSISCTELEPSTLSSISTTLLSEEDSRIFSCGNSLPNCISRKSNVNSLTSRTTNKGPHKFPKRSQRQYKGNLQSKSYNVPASKSTGLSLLSWAFVMILVIFCSIVIFQVWQKVRLDNC